MVALHLILSSKCNKVVDTFFQVNKIYSNNK